MSEVLLALDTATEACSAALWIDGAVTSRFEVSPRAHTRLLLPMAEQLLHEAGQRPADLDAVVLSRGPGSFTGVRIAASVAQGIAFATSIPIVPVSTLATLAQGAFRRCNATRVAAAIDARMNQVYFACFEQRDGLLRALTDEAVLDPAAVRLADDGPWHGAGSGWAAYADAMPQVDGEADRRNDQQYPHAQDLLQLGVAAWRVGEGVAPELAVPVYLRDKVAHQPS